MTFASNTVTEHLAELNRLLANALKIINSFHDAIVSDNVKTTLSLTNADGSQSVIEVATNTYLNNEITRLSKSLENVIDAKNNVSGAIVNLENNDYREVFVSSYNTALSAIKRAEIQVDNNVKLSSNSLLSNLTSTSMLIDIALPSEYANVRHFMIERYRIPDSQMSLFIDGESRSSVIKKLATNNIDCVFTEDQISSVPLTNRYYGSFDVLDIKKQPNGNYILMLSDIRYNDTANVSLLTRELDINDILITNNGRSKYKILSVTGQYVTVMHESGFGQIETGSAKLLYNFANAQSKTIQLPVVANERSIVFVSPIHKSTDYASEYSGAIILNSTKFSIEKDAFVHNFDAYVANNIVNIGSYLESLAREGVMSRSMSIPIDKPFLTNESFKVVQVNKHLTNTANATKLRDLVATKNRTNSEITILNNSISELTTRINIGNYKSTSERMLDESALSAKIEQKDSKTALFASTVSDINALVSETDYANVAPKYRIRGFWNVNEPTNLVTGVTQRIVQYEFRYRYVSVDTDTSDVTMIKIGDDTGVISAWTGGYTLQLEKVYNALTNSYTWAINKIDSANISNINEIDIPISFGESVQLQVRAIGEAGYPVNPVKSEWSNALTVEFPEQLAATQQLKTLVQQNSEDMVSVAVEQQFKSQGLTEHVSESFTERDKRYSHTASKIFSGFVTPDQTSISVFEKMKSMDTEIQQLREIVLRRALNISVDIVDETGAITNVNNMSSINLFAGYYTDAVDINNESMYGSIVEKTFYVKLSNKNAQTAELLTISPGNLVMNTLNQQYLSVAFCETNESNPLHQLNGQIVYNRSTDVTGTIDLVKSIESRSIFTVTSSDINQIATQENKNVVHWSGSAFERIGLNANAASDSYFAIHRNHPLYKQYETTQNTENETALKLYMQSATSMTAMTRQDFVQPDVDSIDHVGFNQYDKYLINKLTCGAKLFMQVNNKSSLQVQSSDNAAAKLIQPGDSNALLIPIKFQYRMTDALGRLNGDTNLTVSASNIEYKKRIGFDLLISNSIFKFDLTVNAKFRPSTISGFDTNVNTVIDNISNRSTVPTIL